MKKIRNVAVAATLAGAGMVAAAGPASAAAGPYGCSYTWTSTGASAYCPTSAPGTSYGITVGCADGHVVSSPLTRQGYSTRASCGGARGGGLSFYFR